mgnify:CR=1 FL=1
MNNCLIKKLIIFSFISSNFWTPQVNSRIALQETFEANKQEYFRKKNKKDLIKSFNVFLYESLLVNSNVTNANTSLLESEDNIGNQTVEFNELLIESKVQSQRDNKLFADGSVVVKYKGNILKADTLIYNKETEVVEIEGNISLKINNQIFEADKIEYDFINQTGSLINLKGLIDAEYIISDLDFQFAKDNNRYTELIEKIKKDKVLFTPNKVTNWILSAENMSINKNKWSTKKAFFKNDLLDSNQLQIQLNDLDIYTYKQKLRFKSKVNYLILENKTTIPFWFGDRTIIKDSENRPAFENRWNIGYDNLYKDGFFISRKLNPININDDLFFIIEPQFLFQRTIKGETESFVQKNYALNSPRIKRDIAFLDYFALNSSIEGNINDWNLKINKELNSFDVDKFANALRVKAELNREINFFDHIFVNRFFGAYRNRIWNGSIGESEIYGAYGWQLDNTSSWKSGLIENHQNIIFGLGTYKAEELETNNLVRSYKGKINYQLEQKIPIKQKKINSYYIDKTYKYIPKPIQQGTFINTKIDINYDRYNGDNFQQYLGLGFGPEIIFGNFKKDFFDYTRVSALPTYKFKSGKSVFKFDQVSEKFTIDLNFDQQLINSWLIETQGTLNLDHGTDDYGKFINSKIALNRKRRSYSFGIFYMPHNESGGINFSLNGFI